jgi:hypothetical protein
MRPKIIARVFGGMGNQLFIYAAARRLAFVNDAELVLDDVSGFVRDYVYKRHYQLDHFAVASRKATPAERFEPFARARRWLKRRWNARLPLERRNYIQQEGFDFDPRLLDLKPRGPLHLEGYWQSEGYFKDVEAIIRQDLAIRPPNDAANQALATRISAHKAVAAHVRFFDEPQAGGINNAPGDYYQRAIAEMERRVPGAHYYLFSDRPEAARERIPLADNRITIVGHNRGDAAAIADLWLMTQCRHFIIANSTFSWWGAWLADNQDKHVIAPGFGKAEGVMSWGFDGLLPQEWIKL